MIDFAARAHNHNYRLDPVVRSLLDTDFYKFVMQQFILEYYPKLQVEFSLTNRTTAVRLADHISLAEMREQLDYARTVFISSSEVAFMRGQKFYGQQDFFSPKYIGYLEKYRLPDYELSVDEETGQFKLASFGDWVDRTLWEMAFLTITNELLTRAYHRKLSRFELIELYSRATVKLTSKLREIAAAKLDGLNLTDFGTRRRHSHLWQEFCIEAARDIIGDGFTGTSNVFFAKKLDLEARGTNAHELPMAIAASTRISANEAMTPEMYGVRLRASQYRVLDEWAEMYPQPLRVILPDTFGTTQFLKGAPDRFLDWNGARPDSKEPHAAALELYDWWKAGGQDPKDKLILFSDGLNHNDIITLHREWAGKVRVAFGWGTNLTNDFKGCFPADPELYKPISLVSKVNRVGTGGRKISAVKLSDNYNKATSSDPTEVEVYRKAFGHEGMAGAPVLV